MAIQLESDGFGPSFPGAIEAGLARPGNQGGQARLVSSAKRLAAHMTARPKAALARVAELKSGLLPRTQGPLQDAQCSTFVSAIVGGLVNSGLLRSPVKLVLEGS